MKRIIIMCLAIIIVLGCFAACGENKNDAKTISLSNLETELEIVFKVEETSNGYSFKCTDETWDITYSGTTDKNKNVTSITIVYENVSTDIVSSKSKMFNVLNRLKTDYSSLTFGETKAANSFVDILSLYTLLGVEDTSEGAILSIICEGKTVTISGWSISSKITDSNLTITMKS